MPWLKLIFVVVLGSMTLVFMSALIPNEVWVRFSASNDGFPPPASYGFPIAFEEKAVFIDTSTVFFHWGFFLLDVLMIVIPILLLLYVINRARTFDKD